MKNGINPASATSPAIVSQIRGDAYSDAALSDGNHMWTGGLEPWMKASNGTFVPYILSQNATHYIVDNKEAPFVINKNNCITSIYDNSVPLSQNPASLINKEWWDVSYHAVASPLFTTMDLSSTACTMSVKTNSSGIFIDTLKAFPAGTLEVTYEKVIGKPWETILIPTNTLPASSYSIKPIERISGISADSIVVGTAPFNGNTTLSSQQINQSSSIITIHKGAKSFIIDESKALANFKQLNITKISSGFSLSTDFGSNVPVLSTNQKFTIDPTFGFTSGTVYTPRHVHISSACDGSYDFSAGVLYATANAYCSPLVDKWDITSIPATAIITSVTFKYNVTSITNPRNCDYWSIEKDPATASATTIYLDSWNGTKYVSADSGCTTVSNGKSLNLGSSAVADVQSDLSRHWWALGQAFTTPDTAGAGTVRSDSSGHLIQIVYTPAAPIGLTTPTQSTTAITPRWSSVLGATWYLLDRESPTGHGFSQITNTTSLSFADTGLTAGTQYNYEIFAGASGGAGPASAPSSNYTNPLVFPSNDNFTGSNTFVKAPSFNSGIIIHGNITAPNGICIGAC